MAWNDAVWVNGKREIKGRWIYHWASDKFVIELDSKDRITGSNRTVETSNDSPEWGNWKLKKETP